MSLGFNSETRRYMWVEFVGSLLCSERFFSEYSSFSSAQKPTLDLIWVPFIHSASLRSWRFARRLGRASEEDSPASTFSPLLHSRSLAFSNNRTDSYEGYYSASNLCSSASGRERGKSSPIQSMELHKRSCIFCHGIVDAIFQTKQQKNLCKKNLIS